MDDLFSRGDFYTVEAGSHLMLCGRIVSGKMAKKGGMVSQKTFSYGIANRRMGGGGWIPPGGCLEPSRRNKGCCCFSVANLCLALYDPVDCSRPGSSLCGTRQEYWSGLRFPAPGDHPDPGIPLVSPVWQADSLPLSHQGNPGTSVECKLPAFLCSLHLGYCRTDPWNSSSLLHEKGKIEESGFLVSFRDWQHLSGPVFILKILKVPSGTGQAWICPGRVSYTMTGQPVMPAEWHLCIKRPLFEEKCCGYIKLSPILWRAIINGKQ